MLHKDLLVLLNIFGTWDDEDAQAESYINTLDSIFWHINRNPQYQIRVVISSVLVNEWVLFQLKDKFKDKITIFKFNKRYIAQVSANKTVISSISLFQEEYQGYFYISSGILLPKKVDLFSRIIEKNNSNDYGIIQLQVDKDAGYEYLGSNYIDKTQDYNIPVGCNCNFHLAIFNKSLKDFYNIPFSDVHGFCSAESGFSYLSYALRKKYIILGDSECIHVSNTGYNESNTDRQSWEVLKDEIHNVIGYNNPPKDFFSPGAHLLWGRTIDTFLNDIEGIKSGLGYYPGLARVDWGGIILPHDESKYDENYLSLDPKLKESVKRNYFTNKNEIDYDKINYTIHD